MKNFSAAFNECAVCREFPRFKFYFGIVPSGAISSKSAAIFIVNNKVDFNSNVNTQVQVDI